jgi:hypothetical protein
LIKQDKEGHSILIKGEIDQKEMTTINLYAPNVTAPNFIKHTLKDLKAYTNSETVVVRDINTPLSSINNQTVVVRDINTPLSSKHPIIIQTNNQ